MSDRLNSMARFDQSEDDGEGWESRLEPLAAVYRKAEGKIEDALLSFETEHLQKLHVDAHQPTRQSGWAVYFIAVRIRGMTRKILRDRGENVPDAEMAELDASEKMLPVDALSCLWAAAHAYAETIREDYPESYAEIQRSLAATGPGTGAAI